ncbi:alpha/beta fold hydrolase [Wohlfahrtiimonas chitiniclastica]|uniref:alpha/beta fold hydrolase n=1 Tax=Wohlfahrtiimonas chitiniclastica TaxID=400946 RepID=UPI000B998E8C|nr:alpha/beta fold hydrolase [Wohlfahrtiimonas chitiniclastica]OYQ75980.1 alpha/beta hydrolase [Wohlfahrtiimonas chitiniclastica]
MHTLLNHKITQPDNPQHATPIVLIHGLFGDMNNLGMIARALADYTTIQVDVRNHGESFHTDVMNYGEMAKDVVTLLDHLNVEKAIIIGHSMGGKIAMRMTEMMNDRITALIVIDVAPVAYQENRHSEIFAALKAVSAEGITDRKIAAAAMAEYLDEPFVIQFLLKSFRVGKGEWKFNVPVLENQYANIVGWETIAPWNGACLFIVGGDSPYVSRKDQTAITAQLPNVQAKVIAGAGHWVHAQKTDAVVRAIDQFLSKVDAP